MISHVRRVQLLALAAGLPAVALALVLLSESGWGLPVRASLAGGILGVWLGLTVRLAEHIDRPLQTIANLLATGDEIRARPDVIAASDPYLGQAPEPLPGPSRADFLKLLEA